MIKEGYPSITMITLRLTLASSYNLNIFLSHTTSSNQLQSNFFIYLFLRVLLFTFWRQHQLKHYWSVNKYILLSNDNFVYLTTDHAPNPCLSADMLKIVLLSHHCWYLYCVVRINWDSRAYKISFQVTWCPSLHLFFFWFAAGLLLVVPDCLRAETICSTTAKRYFYPESILLVTRTVMIWVTGPTKRTLKRP